MDQSAMTKPQASSNKSNTQADEVTPEHCIR